MSVKRKEVSENNKKELETAISQVSQMDLPGMSIMNTQLLENAPR